MWIFLWYLTLVCSYKRITVNDILFFFWTPFFSYFLRWSDIQGARLPDLDRTSVHGTDYGSSTRYLQTFILRIRVTDHMYTLDLSFRDGEYLTYGTLFVINRDILTTTCFPTFSLKSHDTYVFCSHNRPSTRPKTSFHYDSILDYLFSLKFISTVGLSFRLIH